MSKDYLIHNGQLLSTDELMHKNFKYITKKKVNGKWRYYYYNPTTDEYGKEAREEAYVTNKKSAQVIENLKKVGLSTAGDDPHLETMTDAKRRSQRNEQIVNEKKYRANVRLQDKKKKDEKDKKNILEKGKRFLEKIFNKSNKNK